MTISIHLLSLDHAEELLEFEQKNRRFFEASVPSRGDGYYNIDTMREILGSIEEEQERGECAMYLIRDEQGTLAGRVNLVSIDRGLFQKAEIGFRVGQAFNGKGYSTQAVRLACAKAFDEMKLHRIEAGAAPTNIGSQIVLIKNGFQFYGRSRQHIQVKGSWEDGVLFEKLNKE